MKFTVKHALALLVCIMVCSAIGVAARYYFNEDVFSYVLFGGLFVFFMQFANQKGKTPNANN